MERAKDASLFSLCHRYRWRLVMLCHGEIFSRFGVLPQLDAGRAIRAGLTPATVSDRPRRARLQHPGTTAAPPLVRFYVFVELVQQVGGIQCRQGQTLSRSAPPGGHEPSEKVLVRQDVRIQVSIAALAHESFLVREVGSAEIDGCV